MIFEGIINRTERKESIYKEIEALEDEIRDALKEIEKKTPWVVEEFQSLTPEQQDRVSQTVLAYLEKSYRKDIQNLLPGSIMAGITTGGISSAFGGPKAGAIGAVVGIISTAGLVPLMHKLTELQARRFFDSNKDRQH